MTTHTLEHARQALRDELIERTVVALYGDAPLPASIRDGGAIAGADQVADLADAYVKLGGDLELPANPPIPELVTEAELRIADLEGAIVRLERAWNAVSPAYKADLDMLWTPLTSAIRGLVDLRKP